jgi:hypothetical protein
VLKPDLASITTTMISAYAEMRQSGEKRPFGQAFPFRAEHVAGIHTFKSGEGAGTWFRLKDGRVYTRHGAPAATEANLYDTAADTARAPAEPTSEDLARTEALALQEEAVAGMKKSLSEAVFNDGRFAACKAALQGTKNALAALQGGDSATAALWLTEARAEIEKARQASAEARDETEL